MASKLLLREWSDSEWPEDDFTPEANAQDLAGHIDDHEKDLAYGYSVLTPEEDRLLGSLYVNEVAPFLENYHADEAAAARLAGFDARVEFWLREGTSPELAGAFLGAVLEWLDREWWFRRVAFGSRRSAQAQRDLYEALGLVEAVRLESRDGTRRFHFHARPEA